MITGETKQFLDLHGLQLYNEIVEEKIATAIGGVSQFNVQVVEELPETGDTHTIYFTPSNNSSSTPEPDSNLMMYNNSGVVTVDFSTQTDVITGLSVGDVFKYIDGGLGSFIVPSSIDKNSIKMTFTSDEYSNPKMCFNTGITSTIELQDEHYYVVKDMYYLKGRQIDGGYGVYYAVLNYGFVVLIFEEVEEPESVKYDGITYIPGGLMLSGYEYTIYPKIFTEIYKKEETDPETHETVVSHIMNENIPLNEEMFPQMNIGETVRITGDNNGYEGNPYICAISVDDNVLSLTVDSGVVSGIVEDCVWEKNECYKLIDYHDATCYGYDSVEFVFKIPTFEKVTNVTVPDYEFHSLRGGCYTKEREDKTMDEYMWIDDDWELIGNTKVDLSNYYTKDEVYDKYTIDGLLDGKSDTGHTHEQYSLTSHTHTISNISGLTEELNNKSNTGHTHDDYVLKSVFESSTYAFSSHINELTERVDADDAIQNITVEDVIDELNIIDNN